MNSDFYELIEENPVIAAVKDEPGLDTCCSCENIRVVFILYGNICNVDQIVKKIKDAGKVAIVHVDLIDGLGGREIAIDFIKNHTNADGIISTKSTLIRRAKEQGMYAILRAFILDSISFRNVHKQVPGANADALEILPGLMPKIIHKLSGMLEIPVIAGGLISDKEDVMNALASGAISVSTTNPEVWEM